MRKLILTSFIAISAITFVPKDASAEGLLGSVGKSVGEIVEGTTTEVVEETIGAVETVLSEVQIDAGLVDVDTTEGVQVNAPLVKTEVSEEKGVSINTVVDANVSGDKVEIDAGVVDIKASGGEGLKVKAPVVEADVSLTEGVKVKAPVVEADLSPEKGVQVETPIVRVDIPPTTEVTTEIPLVSSDEEIETKLEQPSQESRTQGPDFVENLPIDGKITKVEETPAVNSVQTANPMSEQTVSEGVSTQLDFKSFENKSIPLEIDSKVTKSLEVEGEKFNLQNGVTTPSPSMSFAGLTTSLSTMPSYFADFINDSIFSEEISAVAYSRTIYLLFDQWTNAPPSQPPQSSSFFEMSKVI